MPPDLVPNASNLIIAIVVALVTYFLTRRHERKVHERNRRQAACDKFRAAISQEISLWHRLDSGSHGIIGSLHRRLPELENSSIIAILIEFRPFVRKNAENYDKARKTYEKYKKEVSEDYGFAGSHPVPIKLLETFLRFAEE